VDNKFIHLFEETASHKLPVASCQLPAASFGDATMAGAKVIHSSYLIVFLLLISIESSAQIVSGAFDTTRTAVTDTLPAFKGKKVITIESYAKRFDPRKALLYAAIFPGSGQAYNKKYWKMPIVYGGFAATIYVISFYQGEYNKYKSELFSILNEPGKTTSPSGYTEDQLRSLVSRNRRERDFYTALTGLWYVLQMVDAHVDAHLKEFDLNPQLQVRLEPSMNNDPYTGRSTGLSLKLRF
jgi:hypothetical protein